MPFDHSNMGIQKAGFERAGLKVSRINKMKYDDMKAALASKDTWGISYFGHGAQWQFWTDSYSSSIWDQMGTESASGFLHHGLALLLNQACSTGSGIGDYGSLVTKNGVYGYHNGLVVPASYIILMNFRNGTYSQ